MVKSQITAVQVRQGSVLSPALFSLYMNELLVKLRNLGVGCHIGGIFFGAVLYVDDPVLPRDQLFKGCCKNVKNMQKIPIFDLALTQIQQCLKLNVCIWSVKFGEVRQSTLYH